jgi:hypothetical protein
MRGVGSCATPISDSGLVDDPAATTFNTADG